ncbi:NADH-quinone oxidoreductase subunit C [Neobacillus sp. PS3-34]|uniref:NADH-quinone oxidoreductase subunit C n=1 Tax=Neobacillus sp. PS3-34 TaxID=3070678 RepID=UPI0027E020A7|nr:NADH-quinone oxidoreductase subunit C [Neobacillus sp. PS3-34]WML46573.1 NADH-quinone oxidoreductase subunit C [Neobacillus sp. PS3-34]
MSGEKDLDQLKKEAAEKAKAAALAKRQAKLAGEAAPVQESKPSENAPVVPEEASATESADYLDLAKQKAAAAAKAKAAALAKKKAAEQGGDAAPAQPEPSVESAAPASDAGDADLAKRKAAAAAKAKAAALAKMKAKEAAEGAQTSDAATTSEASSSGDDADLAKRKAAAAAKAKAAALAKMKASGVEAPAEEAGDDAKAKAAAAAKAKAAAAAKAKAAALAKQAGGADAGTAGDDEKAKAIAAAKAKAAAAAKAKAAAAAKAGGDDAPAAEEAKPSPNQPYLDKYVKVIEENLGTDILEDSYINKISKDVPTLVAKRDTYFKVAQFLKYNERLGFDYLSELHGTDFETHMEIYVHLYSYKNRQSVALKVKIDRDEPTIDSLQPIWEGANWPECEAFDLLGIKFTGHPNLHRIMLGEEWVGHPLRKDYEQYDVEV